MTFEKVIGNFKGDLGLHAKFINTLSLMEYIGARKIIKSQREDRVTDGLLSHMAEEVRHAQILKRLALKMSGGELDSYSPEHILGAQASREYMQTVDYGSVEILGTTDPWHNYILSTWLIEERAMQVYPVYEPVLTELGFSGYIRAIMKDEEKHLAEVRRDTKAELNLTEDAMTRLLAMEAAAFDRFMAGVDQGTPQKPVEGRAFAGETMSLG